MRALQAGAIGYLTKDATRAEIGRAVHAAAAGQAVLDPVVQQRLLSATATPTRRANGGIPAPGSRAHARAYGVRAGVSRSREPNRQSLPLARAAVSHRRGLPLPCA